MVGSSSRRKVGNDEYHGVREGGNITEVRNWFNRLGDKPKSVGFYKGDKRMCKRLAALLYDLVRVYENPAIAKDKLNVDKVVRAIQRELGVVVEEDSSARGFQCLEEWVAQNPLMHRREAWELLTDAQTTELKDDIMEKARGFQTHLEDTISNVLCEDSRSGCRRAGLDQIFPSVAVDPTQELDETRDLLRKKDAEFASLKAAWDAERAFLVKAKDDENASLKEANEALRAKCADLEARKMCWCQGVDLPECEIRSPQMLHDDLQAADFDASRYNSGSAAPMLNVVPLNADFDASRYNLGSAAPMLNVFPLNDYGVCRWADSLVSEPSTD